MSLKNFYSKKNLMFGEVQKNTLFYQGGNGANIEEMELYK